MELACPWIKIIIRGVRHTYIRKPLRPVSACAYALLQLSQPHSIRLQAGIIITVGVSACLEMSANVDEDMGETDKL